MWIIATNPLVSLPDADQVRRALDKCELVVVSDIIAGTDTNAYADVLLPALGWGEKDGTVTNSERRISRQRAFLPAPGEARADWEVLCEVAQRMGFGGFDFDGAAGDLRRACAPVRLPQRRGHNARCSTWPAWPAWMRRSTTPWRRSSGRRTRRACSATAASPMRTAGALRADGAARAAPMPSTTTIRWSSTRAACATSGTP